MCVCVYVGYTLGMAGVLGASIVQGEVLMLLSVTRKGSRWPNHSRTVSISHGHYNTYSLDARENLAQVFSVFFVFCFFPSPGYYFNSMARKFPIQKCMGKIAVQLKSHGNSEIARGK